MIADMSIRPMPTADLSPSARPAPQRPTASAVAERQVPASPSAPRPAADDVEDGAVVERLRSMLTDTDLRIRTQHDPDTNRTVMRFEDRVTGKTVEQFPSEQILKLYAAIREPFIDQEV